MKRCALFVGVVCATIGIQAAPLKIVQVAAPDIFCLFDSSCTISPADSGSFFAIPQMVGEGLLHSRTFAGKPGTTAEGLHAYLYRIDLAYAAPRSRHDPVNCIVDLKIDFGPVAMLDFDLDRTDDQVFVISSGDAGSVGVVSADEEAGWITFRLGVDLSLCPPQSSYFIGVVSATGPATTTARMTDTLSGTVIAAEAQAPARPAATAVLSRVSGEPGGSVMVTGTVAPGSAGVRILWYDGENARGLAEGTVAPDGSFSLLVQVPEDAAPGAGNIGALKFGSDGSDLIWAPFDVVAPQPGTITGIVTDKFGMAVGGTTVQLLDPLGLPVAQTTTDGQGNYNFEAVFPGVYVVEVPLPGYAPKNTQVEPGGTYTANPSAAEIPLSPIFVLGVGAIALPGGSYSATQPAQVGEWGNLPWARLASIPGKGLPPVNVRFWIDMKHMALSPDIPLWAEFKFIKNGATVASKTALAKTQVFNTSPYNGISAFTADFNSLELPPGELTLRINARAGGSGQKTKSVGTMDYPVYAADLGGRWYAGNAANPQFGVTRKDFFTLRYQFQGNLPPSSIAFNEPIDLGLVTLNNKMTFGIPIKETFFSSGEGSGEASITAQVTLLGIDFINEKAAYQAPSGSGFLWDSYTLPTIFKDLTGKQCTPIPGLAVDAYKCINLCIVGCKKCAGIKVGAFFCIQGYVNFDSEIKSDLKVTALASPGIIVSVPIEAVFDIVVCHASASIEPQANAYVPIYYDRDRSPIIGFDQPCLQLSATLNYKFKCFGKTFFSGSKGLGSKQFGCSSGRSDGVTLAGASEHDSPELPHPSIAASENGTSMAVWLPDESELPAGAVAHKPYYSFFNGTEWTEPAPIYPAPDLGDDPHVVFLDANRALAVWTHARFLPANDELTEDEEGQLFSSFELRYAIWDGMAWSAPALLTNDDVYDGRPSLAANPVSDSALLVWLRHDVTVPGEDPLLTLFHSTYASGVWTPPQRLDPAATALDFQASVRFDSLGNPGVAWVRDMDGDVVTPEDRQLMFATSGRGGWGAPELIAETPPGPWTPSLAFDLEGRPIIAFVVPSASPETGELLGGDGNSSRLAIALKGPDGWQSQIVAGGMFAERPVVRVNSDNQAIVMFRRFGLGHESGDLAAAAADMNPPDPDWTADYLTDDNRVNWQVAFDIAPDGAEHFLFWQKRTPGSGATVPGENTRMRFPRGVDLSFAEPRIVFSNPELIPGEVTDVVARIKNAGLRTLLDAPFTVRFYDVFPEPAAEPFFEVVVNAPIAFGEEVEVVAPYMLNQVGRRAIYVVLDAENTVTELNENNNMTSELLTPKTAPVSLLAYANPTRSTIALEWQLSEGIEDANFAIFRAPSNDPQAFEFVGFTQGMTWTDFLAHPGGGYLYKVAIMDDGLSAPAATTAPVSIVPEIFAPGFLAPVLSAVAFEDAVTLFWSARPGMVLEQTSVLEGPATRWELVEAPGLFSGGLAQVSVPAVQSGQYFRLAIR